MAVTGSFTATGQSSNFTPHVSANPNDSAPFNIALYGTGVGTVKLQKSFDGGANWLDIYAGGTPLYAWSYSSSNFVEVAEETESDVVYRLNCTAYTSGTINYRLSQ